MILLKENFEKYKNINPLLILVWSKMPLKFIRLSLFYFTCIFLKNKYKYNKKNLLNLKFA
jgi:hypothetical protein